MRHAEVCSFVTWSAEGLYSTEMEGKMVDNNKKDHTRSM